jgi:uncharacterized repeat protein (TIGR01451 family)
MRRPHLARFSLVVVAALLMGLAGNAGAAPAGSRHLTVADASAIEQTGQVADGAFRQKQQQQQVRRAVQVAGPGNPIGLIVKLDVDALASYQGGLPGLPATSPSVTGKQLDVRSPESARYLAHIDAKQREFAARAQGAVPQVRTVQRFDHVLGGVAVTAPADRINEIAALPGVRAVHVDELVTLTTDRSPAFVDAPAAWGEVGGQDEAGEGVIVGVLDSGIWPEHPSLSDPDPLGKAYPAPPAPVSGTRACEFSGGGNPGPAFTCNNKLIGADRFMATYDTILGLKPGEFTTARDDDGHGTHTATTAAGNRGVPAVVQGIDRGTISGIAPRAHVIAYKVCGDEGCYQSDSVAAIQKAILDGVNVINFSISGGSNPYGDAVELAFLDAYNAGVFVAASAGNAGPGAETVDHRGPWVTTVGASTTSRGFQSTLTLIAGNGARLLLTGSTITPGISRPAEVVVAANAPFNDPFCLNSTADGAFAGKIVLCARGTSPRIIRSYNVAQRGAVGLILYNSTPNQGLFTDNHFIPSIHLENNVGLQAVQFLGSRADVSAFFTPGSARTIEGDVMAGFSSRGGPGQTLGISKPDLTAPGRQILAGNSPQPATLLSGKPGELFQAIQGTSMSSPHVAGAAALLKDRHPTWTAGQIKSALMTTASPRVVKEDGETPATPFDMGAGRIDLSRAGEPGLTFDVTGADFIARANQLYTTNYPSLYIPSMPGMITVRRTARSVLPGRSAWSLSVRSAARDLAITVPSSFAVAAGETHTFDITIDARAVPLGQTRFASLRLTSGPHQVEIPITIVRGQTAVTLTKSCAPAVFRVGETTECTITAANPSSTDATISIVDTLPTQLRLVPGSATGGATETGNGIAYGGLLAGAQPPDVSIAPGPSVAGYLPLGPLGVTPIGGVGDDTIANFNVPAFLYGGELYTRVGISSNGYVVIGGASGPDNSLNNQNFPDPARPNNVIAPFWTDLNPAAAGALRIGSLTDGADRWLVIEWENVREFSTDANRHSFQIWIGLNGDANPGEDISVAYGPNQGAGDLGFATVGVENRNGSRGNVLFRDGAGTLPTEGTELRVSGSPGRPGATLTLTFRATGRVVGKWTNDALMTGDTFNGTSIARFQGEVKVR